jgi:hypothetical protein
MRGAPRRSRPLRRSLIALPLIYAVTAGGCGTASVPEPSRDSTRSEWAYAGIVQHELDSMRPAWWWETGNGPAIEPTRGVRVYEGRVVVSQYLQKSAPKSSTETACDDLIRSLDRTAGERPSDVAVSEVWFHRRWYEQREVVLRCELAAETRRP